MNEQSEDADGLQMLEQMLMDVPYSDRNSNEQTRDLDDNTFI